TPALLHSFPTRRSSDLAKSCRQAEGQQQGRNVLPRLQGDDRLPGDADALGQFLLGQLAVVEAEPPNPVRKFLRALIRHPYVPPRSEEHTSELQSRFDLV